MNIESYKKKQKRLRIIIWVGIASAILVTWVSMPSPLPKPEYVPTIISGLVTSMSILMAFTLFQLTQTTSSIRDEIRKAEFRLRAVYYLIALFSVLVLGILFGYRLVLEDDLGHSFSWFMSMFIIIAGLAGDLPSEIDI